MMERKQCVWIVRYGLTEHPLVENVGPFDSDIDPQEGIEHAKCIAQRIAKSGKDAPKIVFSSPFLRTTHTAHIIALEQAEDVSVKLEEGLWEWLTPSLLVEPNGVKTEPKSPLELAVKFDTIDTDYKSVNPVEPDESTNVPAGAPHFVESEEKLIQRCELTISRLLDGSIWKEPEASKSQSLDLGHLEALPCLHGQFRPMVPKENGRWTCTETRITCLECTSLASSNGVFRVLRLNNNKHEPC